MSNNSNEIAIVADLFFKPEMAAQAKQIMAQIVAPSRKDVGCLYYNLFQDNSSANCVTLIESWASKTDWEAHSKTKHITEALAKLEPCFSEPPNARFFCRAS
jgi:quinol monooxygenase YgiN